ncbi:MAG: response regulator [Actinobacteria bacterium]|nr:response regulator [Actinomycetota bacterium]
MQPRIMIVDDAAFMRKKIRRILADNGYREIVESSNGREAIAAYMEYKPDLVTMDIVMPGMDGIAVLQEIRKFDPDAKVIMISAMGQKRMVVEAIQAGALDFILKPFDNEMVISTISKFLPPPEQ